MNVAASRWIDRWAGIPLCFLLTIIARISRLFQPGGAARAEPRRVLFIELAEMGTTVVACPALQRLKDQYPQSDIYFVLFKQIAESVRVLGVIPDDHVLTIDASSLFTIARDTVRFMAATRRLGIDTSINLEMFARFSTILGYLSGARARVGFHPFTQPGLYIGDLLTHKVQYSPHLHTWQSLVALVNALGEPADGRPLGKQPAPTEWSVPRVRSDDAAKARIQAIIARENPRASGKRLIVINPNASALIAIRKWPLEHYAALIGRLLEDPRFACAITGVASESPDARFILDRVRNDRVVDLTGKTTLRELIDLFNIAELLVTNDSGPAHFAALTDIPVAVFFGPETPELYRPLARKCAVLYSNYACSPCVSAYNQRLSPCTNNLCLKTIDVATVHARLLELIA